MKLRRDPVDAAQHEGEDHVGLEMEGNFSMQLEGEEEMPADQAMEALLGEGGSWEGKEVLTVDDLEGLRETLKKMKGALMFERQRSAVTSSIDEKERGFLFDGFSQTTKG